MGDKPPRCLFPRQTARRSTSTCSVRAYLSQRRIITSQSTTTLIPRTSTSSRLASPLPPADTSRPNPHGNITTTPSPLRVLTTSANGFTSPPRLSQLPTSSNNDRTPLPAEWWVVRVSASASLSVDVAAVVVTVVEIVREDTADVMLVERARRVHHLESSLLNSAVVSDVVPDVVELLLPLRLVFRYACSCIRQKFLQNSSMVGLDSSAFGRVIEIAGVE